MSSYDRCPSRWQGASRNARRRRTVAARCQNDHPRLGLGMCRSPTGGLVIASACVSTLRGVSAPPRRCSGDTVTGVRCWCTGAAGSAVLGWPRRYNRPVLSLGSCAARAAVRDCAVPAACFILFFSTRRVPERVPRPCCYPDSRGLRRARRRAAAPGRADPRIPPVPGPRKSPARALYGPPVGSGVGAWPLRDGLAPCICEAPLLHLRTRPPAARPLPSLDG